MLNAGVKILAHRKKLKLSYVIALKFKLRVISIQFKKDGGKKLTKSDIKKEEIKKQVKNLLPGAYKTFIL